MKRNNWKHIASAVFVASVFVGCCGIKGNLDQKALALAAYQEADKLWKADLLKNEGKILDELDKAIALDPRQTRYRAARGKLHLMFQQPGMAYRDFLEWTRIDPQSAFAYFQLGLALDVNKHYGDAIDAHSKAIALDKKADFYAGRADSYKAISYLWSALSDYKEAKELLDKGEITHKPFNPITYPQIYINLSELLFDMGYLAESVRISDEFIKKYPEWSDFFKNEIREVDTGDSIQIGRAIPEFSINSGDGDYISKQNLLGRPYVFFRWEPKIFIESLRDYDFYSPMDAILLQDDISCLLNSYYEIKKLGVGLISIVTKPFNDELEKQIYKNRYRGRPWKLFELTNEDKSWMRKDDCGGGYRLLVVDKNGIIQLALWHNDTDSIKNTVLPLLKQLLKGYNSKTMAGG